MPRDGSGNYSLPSGNPVVPNTIISSGGWANPTLSDLAAAITQSLSRDGQTTPTANLPMGNFRHTSVANAANRTDYAAAGQVQDSSLQWLTSVAGTDTITASLVPAITAYAAGQSFRFVAAGANTTNAATLNINGLGAKSLTKSGASPISAGDIPSASVVHVVYDGTQFQIISIADLGRHGQCRLAKSGANLVLSPLNGNRLVINGASYAVPAAGVSLAPTSLTPSTLYYIYAYMSAGVMTLEASTTGHGPDANTGVEVKIGDSTRTLVGMARPIAGPAWQDTLAQRFVISWFNQREIATAGFFTTSRSTTSTSYAELNSEIRNEFLTWGTSAVKMFSSGYNSQTNASIFMQTGVGFDGVIAEEGSSATALGNSSAAFALGCTKAGLSEGYHYATLLGLVAAGTGSWGVLVNSAAQRTALIGTIQG